MLKYADSQTGPKRHLESHWRRVSLNRRRRFWKAADGSKFLPGGNLCLTPTPGSGALRSSPEDKADFAWTARILLQCSATPLRAESLK